MFAVLLGTLDASAQSESGRSYYAYVCAESDDEVALVRFGPNGTEVLKRISVGSFPAENEGPHGINVSPDGRHWYVSLAHGMPFGSVHKYETGTDQWVTDVTLGMFPATLDIAASTGLMYIVNFNLHGPMEPSTVSVVETRSMTEVAQVETGVMPHGARLSHDGRWLYTVSMMNDTLVELNALTFEVSRQLKFGEPVENGPAGMESFGISGLVQPTWVSRPTPQGKVYVTGNSSNELFEVDLNAWMITRQFKETGAGPYNLDITPDGRILVVTYKKDAAVGFWDLETGDELGRISTLRTVPHGVAITPDGRYAFITIEGVGGEPGGLEIYDIETRERVGDVEVGKQAGGIAFWKTEP
jgi:DNA-binding beta-propeller fold protein YncE